MFGLLEPYVRVQLIHHGFGNKDSFKTIDEDALKAIEDFGRNNLMKWLDFAEKSKNPEKFQKYFGMDLERADQFMIPLGTKRLILKYRDNMEESDK